MAIKTSFKSAVLSALGGVVVAVNVHHYSGARLSLTRGIPSRHKHGQAVPGERTTRVPEGIQERARAWESSPRRCEGDWAVTIIPFYKLIAPPLAAMTRPNTHTSWIILGCNRREHPSSR